MNGSKYLQYSNKMKKAISLLLSIFILLLLLPTGNLFHVQAESYYPMACSTNEFEVSYINDDGSFSKISCHGSFSSAVKEMKKNDDYVIRYGKSYSPSKIVAMNSGVAYSYPGRRNSSIMYLYQNPLQRESSLYKSTYISNHYEMTYIETCDENIYDISKAGKGYIRVIMNGFEGFADLEYTDLVPSKFLEKGLGIWLGGNNSYEDEDPFLVKVQQNFYQIEKNGKYYDLVFHYYRAYPQSGINGNTALTYSISVDNGENYLKAGMQVGVKYYSADGIRFYSDRLLKNKIAEVFNYYQFLPLRSKTSISSSSFDAFMKKMKGTSSIMANKASVFLEAQEKYGCNALIVYAMACLESAYGTSYYALNRNNLFGWSAYDDSPSDASYFSSVAVCVNEQMGRNLNWFMDYTNRRYFGTCVGNKGTGFNVCYASDPYWGAKIASIAYQIDKYANSSDGNLTDYNAYTLGFVKNNYNDVLYDSSISWDPPIYKNAAENDILYTGRYGTHYQKDLTVIVLDKVDQRYKIQSTNPVKNGSINTDDGVLPYDWNKSVGYIDSDNVDLLYGKVLLNSSDYEHFVSIRKIAVSDSILSIDGLGVIQKMNFASSKNIQQKVIIHNAVDHQVVYETVAEIKDSQGFDLNDSYDYTNTGFIAQIDLTELKLPVGAYYLSLETQNGNIRKESFLFSDVKEDRNFSVRINGQEYWFRMNDNLDYRMEFDVLNICDELDFSTINKISARPSSVSLDGVEITQDGNLALSLHAYMYYLNYTNEEDVSYDVYLLNQNGNCIPMDVQLIDDGINYKDELGSSYALDHISFKATLNVSDLEGDYLFYLKMRKTEDDIEYTDICEIINYGLQIPSVNGTDRNYSFENSVYHKQLTLIIKEIGEQS